MTYFTRGSQVFHSADGVDDAELFLTVHRRASTNLTTEQQAEVLAELLNSLPGARLPKRSVQ